MEPPNSAHAGRGEFEAIARLARALGARQGATPPGEVWIGDDAAVLASPEGQLLFTTDVTVAGVHADLELVSNSDLGWRAMASALSDVAAMGGRPRAAVVAVAGPPHSDLDGLYDGLSAAASESNCPVVGGDLSSSPALTVAVAILGAVAGGPGAVTRRGARPGDAILVSGPLGGSAAGLRMLRAAGRAGDTSPRQPAVIVHLRPRPRLDEGEAARLAGVSAMIDVSDGLVADLTHIALASRVGWELSNVPVFEGATHDEALSGGEDYELVMAGADPDAVLSAFAAAGLRAPVIIGRCVADPSIRLVDGVTAPAAGGWEHSFAAVSRQDRGLH